MIFSYMIEEEDEWDYQSERRDYDSSPANKERSSNVFLGFISPW